LPVRLVREEDWRPARDARLRALDESPAAFLSTFADEEGRGEQEWRHWIRPDERHAWFAEEGGDRFVGIIVVALAERDPRLASIFSMWVDPAHRRLGIGRRLVEAALRWAADQGALQVELEVNQDMDAARSLYEACGFSPTGRSRVLPTPSAPTALQMMRDVAG
jgi:ribosomal protein S18 acetylase RimI-like enzyme